MGRTAGLDRGGWESRPPTGFDPRTVQPLASYYTDYAIPAHPPKQCFENISILLFAPFELSTRRRKLFLGKKHIMEHMLLPLHPHVTPKVQGIPHGTASQKSSNYVLSSKLMHVQNSTRRLMSLLYFVLQWFCRQPNTTGSHGHTT